MLTFNARLCYNKKTENIHEADILFVFKSVDFNEELRKGERLYG